MRILRLPTWLCALTVFVGLIGAPVLADATTQASKSDRTSAAATQKSIKAAKTATANPRKAIAAKSSVQRVKPKSRRAVARQPVRPSFGTLYGLRHVDDPLDLKSSAALVIDQDTDEVLFSKNAQAVLPIASLTKLMTAMIVLDANQSLDETITITEDDVVTERRRGTRLVVGASLPRREVMQLALMSSENRAAHALGRSYPGRMMAFVAAMNERASMLGMRSTRFVEPTGLSSDNQSNPRDLALLVKAAYQHDLIRELSTSSGLDVEMGERQVHYRNTNLLVNNPSWEIGLQKTGYISAAGRCLVMQASLAGRKLIMVFLDSAGKYSRLGDAERVRRWMSQSPALPASRISAQAASAS